MRVLWQDERHKFLEALAKVQRHKLRRRAAMMVLYDTGARVSELAALDLADFDRQRKSLLLINAKVKGHPKREVPIHHRTQLAVSAWVRERPETASSAMFVSQKGNRLSIRALQDDYALVCGLAGIPATGIHTLRHSAATRLLDDHILEVHQVSRRLGHRSIATTYRFYVHASTEVEAKAIRNARL